MIPEPRAHFHFVSIFPEMIEAYWSQSLFRRASKQNLISYSIWNPRSYSADRHQSVDDKPFGGGEGMVMKPEPLACCLEDLFLKFPKNKRTVTLHLSPRGEVLNQTLAQELINKYNQFIFVSSRYSGVDQRFLNDFVDREISLGDYVLSGGELPSLVLCEVLARNIPGFVGDLESVQKDSFSLPGLEGPLYTQPRVWRGLEVPPILTSGHHLRIQQWKESLDFLVTQERRPDLLPRFSEAVKSRAEDLVQSLSVEEKALLGLK